MDSLTQIVLGGSVAALAAPTRHRRAALVTGAVLGTVPDLDVLWFSLAGSDVVTTVTWHRGPSHSLLVLLLLALGLWWLGLRYSAAIRAAPRPWLLAIALALLTHPLLDAFTVYGTQLLWPWPMPPVMGSTVFIIDPLYTVPLLVGVAVAWWRAPREVLAVAPPRTAAYGWQAATAGRNWLLGGLLLSSLYLGWSVVAKLRVDGAAQHSLAALGLAQAPRFSTPTPFNTLLWRVVAMAPDGYYIGDRSLVADQGPMRWTFVPSDTRALAAVAEQAGVQRLLWFTHDFVGAQRQTAGGRSELVLSDLRMGLEPDYSFRYRVARQGADGQWVPLPLIVRAEEEGGDGRARHLRWVWQRIWQTEVPAVP